jgi:hypothetical protein
MAHDLFFRSIALPLWGGALVSYVVESGLSINLMPFWKRPTSSLLIHLGLWNVFFALELALFRRPYFAAANVLALLLSIVLVSNAKHTALSEPFVYQDFEYFIDGLKYPRLFIPFLGLGRSIAALGAIGGAFYGGITLESPLNATVDASTFLAGVTSVFLMGCSLVWFGVCQDAEMKFEPEYDLTNLGLLPCLCRYSVEHHRSGAISNTSVFTAPVVKRSNRQPNLVVVQSESFFDARRMFPGVRQDILQHFDRLKESSVFHGLLHVPVWGASTVRTEFSFLSGVENDSLGINRFNPYRHLARDGISTLVSFLKSQGYRTICVHPYYAQFYARDKVLPKLGFDEFIDIRSFGETDKSGPFIGDVAVADKVCDLMRTHIHTSTNPVFLFIISMENHGPMQLEHVGPDDIARYYTTPPPTFCDDLTVYLRHLGNADIMIEKLHKQLKSFDKNSWFCFYGDHLPIMPKVYEGLGVPDKRTNYILWNKDASHGKAVPFNTRVEHLGVLIAREMGLLKAPGSHYTANSRAHDLPSGARTSFTEHKASR